MDTKAQRTKELSVHCVHLHLVYTPAWFRYIFYWATTAVVAPEVYFAAKEIAVMPLRIVDRAFKAGPKQTIILDVDTLTANEHLTNGHVNASLEYEQYIDDHHKPKHDWHAVEVHFHYDHGNITKVYIDVEPKHSHNAGRGTSTGKLTGTLSKSRGKDPATGHEKVTDAIAIVSGSVLVDD